MTNEASEFRPPNDGAVTDSVNPVENVIGKDGSRPTSTALCNNAERSKEIVDALAVTRAIYERDCQLDPGRRMIH